MLRCAIKFLISKYLGILHATCTEVIIYVTFHKKTRYEYRIMYFMCFAADVYTNVMQCVVYTHCGLSNAVGDT